MRSKTIAAAIAATVLTSGAAQAQNLLINGGFEAPIVGNSCCDTFAAPSSFPGWTVTTGDINTVTGTYASTAGNLAFEGSQYLDLIGQQSTGGIAQTFGTTAGRTYALSFAYSHNLFGGLQSASANYSVGNLAGTVTHSTGSNANLDWRNFSGRFVAGPGNSSTVNFVNTVNGSNAGVLLDAVSITAVPEPATWAMMIVGFGMVGGSLRRRRRTTVAYA